MTLSILDISCVRAARWAARRRRTRSSSDSGRTAAAAAPPTARAGFPRGAVPAAAEAEDDLVVPAAVFDDAAVFDEAEAVAADWELRAFPLACGVFAVKRVASATLRGVPSFAIGTVRVCLRGELANCGAMGASSEMGVRRYFLAES